MRKLLLSLSCLNFLVGNPLYAMHISDGYLTQKDSFMWWGIYLIFFFYGLYKMKKSEKSLEKKLLLALVGAFVFFVSAMKLPSVTGSSSHGTGIALGAILLGVSEMYVIGGVVLLFQALLLAHGGITTLGANGVSMAVVGAVVASLIYKSLKKIGKEKWGIFLGALVGNLATYTCTAFQLALSHGEQGVVEVFSKFLSLFFITQIPLGIAEGMLSLVIVSLLYKEGFYRVGGEIYE